MDYIDIKIMKQYKILIIISIVVLIFSNCNRNILYNEVYCEISSIENMFYENKYKDIDIEIDSAAKKRIKDTYITIFRKISNKKSKYYIDTLANFKLYWNSGGPGSSIWGMIWNNDKIIRFSRNIYRKYKKVEMTMISKNKIIENPNMFIVYDLVNRWDIESIEKLNWKTITDVYSDTALMIFIDNLNRTRNYDLPLRTTDPPIYTAAKIDLTKSEIETIIFQLP